MIMLIQRRRSSKKSSRWLRQLDTPIALQDQARTRPARLDDLQNQARALIDRTISPSNTIFTEGGAWPSAAGHEEGIRNF